MPAVSHATNYDRNWNVRRMPTCRPFARKHNIWPLAVWHPLAYSWQAQLNNEKSDHTEWKIDMYSKNAYHLIMLINVDRLQYNIDQQASANSVFRIFSTLRSRHSKVSHQTRSSQPTSNALQQKKGMFVYTIKNQSVSRQHRHQTAAISPGTSVGTWTCSRRGLFLKIVEILVVGNPSW